MRVGTSCGWFVRVSVFSGTCVVVVCRGCVAFKQLHPVTQLPTFSQFDTSRLSMYTDILLYTLTCTLLSYSHYVVRFFFLFFTKSSTPHSRSPTLSAATMGAGQRRCAGRSAGPPGIMRHKHAAGGVIKCESPILRFST